MAKRKLGLGNVKAKKQKVEPEDKALKAATTITKEDDQSQQNEQEQLLTVELANEVNPEDPLSQLNGLWKTWKDGERNSELILNGIINECDRILRNHVDNGGTEEVELTDIFYSIYGQALSDIAKFKSDEETTAWLENSLDRIDEGFNKFGDDNIRLKFAKCNILLNKIAIEFIGKMTIDSKKNEFKDLKKHFKQFIDTWNEAIKECENKKDFSILNEEWILEILNIFDDLLDIIDKFGTQMTEVVDSDDEGEDEINGEKNADNDVLQESDFQIAEDHPLYAIQNDDVYNLFWRENMLKYRELMGVNVDKQIKKSINEKLGQSYLMEAEEPIAFFSSYQYDNEEDDEDEDEEMKTAVEKSRNAGKELVSKAIEHLREAHDEEDPKTWVNVAEALITYGNLLELESEDQENTYKEAEKLLRRANNACHGYYQDILDSLVN